MKQFEQQTCRGGMITRRIPEPIYTTYCIIEKETWVRWLVSSTGACPGAAAVTLLFRGYHVVYVLSIRYTRAFDTPLCRRMLQHVDPPTQYGQREQSQAQQARAHRRRGQISDSIAHLASTAQSSRNLSGFWSAFAFAPHWPVP